MRAIDYHLKQAEEKGQEWVEFLATYSDKRLVKRLSIIRKQLLIARQNEDEKSFELMLKWEHITICARMHKEEHNIPDTVYESEKNIKEIESVIILSEKRQEILTEIIHQKSRQQITNNESENQLSLFENL